jgi:hypothetical protein
VSHLKNQIIFPSGEIMQKFQQFLLALLSAVIFLMSPARAAENYLAGTISDISSGRDGLYFRYNNGYLPTNCTGSIGNFYVIDKADQTMISVVLSFFMAGNRNVVTFTTGLNAAGYCQVVAFDPSEP